MKKLFTSLRNCSENDKGFSLVELIIVIAIMVALVALLAPQFVKYVQRSRDAVVKSAAEDVLADIIKKVPCPENSEKKGEG